MRYHMFMHHAAISLAANQIERRCEVTQVQYRKREYTQLTLNNVNSTNTNEPIIHT